MHFIDIVKPIPIYVNVFVWANIKLAKNACKIKSIIISFNVFNSSPELVDYFDQMIWWSIFFYSF